jgi:hypothetical protein
VAALRFGFVWDIKSTFPPSLGFCGSRHIFTENLALGSFRSDDWQLGRPTVPPVLSVFP